LFGFPTFLYGFPTFFFGFPIFLFGFPVIIPINLLKYDFVNYILPPCRVWGVRSRLVGMKRTTLRVCSSCSSRPSFRPRFLKIKNKKIYYL
jgi:hypothetical protein